MKSSAALNPTYPKQRVIFSIINMLIIFLISSCSDDFEPSIPQSGDLIKLSATTSSQWETIKNTRSESDQPILANDTVFTLLSNVGDNALYLHTRSSLNNSNPFEEKTAKSRGALLNMSDYDSFGLLAGIYADNWDESTYGANYFYNVKCNKTSNNSYIPSESYYWPGMGQKIRFWGYAPYNHESIRLSELGYKGSPTITYSVPTTNSEQIDLITVQANGVKGGDGSQNLIFNHALTAIQFVAANDINEGNIKSITIKGVYSTAKCVIGSDIWFDYQDTNDFSLEFTPTISVESSNDIHTELVKDENTFLMIPQNLPKEAEIEVEFIDITNTVRTLSTSISNSEWKAGTIITYYISSNSILYTPIFSFEEDSYTFPFSAIPQSKDFPFASYTEVSQTGHSASYRLEPFDYELVDETGNTIQEETPYVTINMLMQNDGSETSNIKPSASNFLSVGALNKYNMVVEDLNEHDKELRETAAVTNVNLADTDEDGKETTANCYIINAPGTYRLPLIYGCAMKDGVVNSNSYRNYHPSYDEYSNFVNYQNKTITNHLIYEDIKPQLIEKCEILWMDECNLLNDLRLSEDGKYLEFNIPKSSIKEGNVLLAIKDSDNKIIWSWHIWITTYNTNNDDITISNGGNYRMMSSYLGYCHPHTRYYPERRVFVKLTQRRTGYAKKIEIILERGDVKDVGNSVYYQWGRKDPFSGQLLDWKENGIISYLGCVSKPIYDMDGHEILQNSIIDKRLNIYETILDPLHQAVTNGNGSVIWHDKIPNMNSNDWWANLWDASGSSTGKSVVKTIYDPSPVGYSVSGQRMFDDFNNVTKIINKQDFSVTLSIAGSNLYLPWTLHRAYTGRYETGTVESYELENFSVWISAIDGNAMLKPGTTQKHFLANTNKFGNAALPLLVVRNP